MRVQCDMACFHAEGYAVNVAKEFVRVLNACDLPCDISNHQHSRDIRSDLWWFVMLVHRACLIFSASPSVFILSGTWPTQTILFLAWPRRSIELEHRDFIMNPQTCIVSFVCLNVTVHRENYRMLSQFSRFHSGLCSGHSWRFAATFVAIQRVIEHYPSGHYPLVPINLE